MGHPVGHDPAVVGRRDLVTVDGRQLLVRRAGEGPLLVLLHDLPGSSDSLSDLIAACAPAAQVVAVDLPGHGLSDPPSSGQPLDDAVVQLVASALRQVVGARAHVVGIGVASLLARRLALEAADAVAGATLVGAPGTAHDRAQLVEHGFPTHEPQLDGSHLLAVWQQVRRSWLFDPWFGTSHRHRLVSDQPPVERLHQQALDVLEHPSTYGDLARALFRAADTPRDLDGDVVEIAGGLPTGELATWLVARTASVADTVSRPEPLPEHFSRVDGGISRTFVDTAAGQVHLRAAGEPSRAPATLLLHQSPGSSVSTVPALRAMSRDRLVVAPDTFGNGASDRPNRIPAPDAAFYADVLAEVLDACDLERVDVLGSHTGAMLGLELAIRHPERVRAVGLDGLVMLEPPEVARILEHYFPSLEPDIHGLHLIRAWNMRLDMGLTFPWFDRTAAAVMPLGLPGPKALHANVVDLLRTGSSWDLSYRAAFAYPTRRSLPLLRRPALLATTPHDVLAPASPKAARLSRYIELGEHAGLGRPDACETSVEVFRAFFDRQD